MIQMKDSGMADIAPHLSNVFILMPRTQFSKMGLDGVRTLLSLERMVQMYVD
jgi:hypothetical protein